MANTNHWLSRIKTYWLPWYLTYFEQPREYDSLEATQRCARNIHEPEFGYKPFPLVRLERSKENEF